MIATITTRFAAIAGKKCSAIAAIIWKPLGFMLCGIATIAEVDGFGMIATIAERFLQVLQRS